MVRESSCVALLCCGEDGAWEVFLAQREVNSPFLGGFLAFFGGGVEVGDEDRSRWSCEGLWRDGRVGVRFYGCAARELEEELGVRMSASDGLLDVGRYVPCGRWVTPDWAALRYETEFFAVQLTRSEREAFEAQAAAERDALLSQAGLLDGRWYELGALLFAHDEGSALLMSAPTVAILRHLRDALQGVSDVSGLERLEEPAFLDAPLLHADHGAGVLCVPLRSPTLAPATHTNCYIFGRDKLLVMDPGTEDEGELARLYAVLDARIAQGAALEAIVLTHHHVDHVCGVPALRARYGAQLPIWAHEANAGLLEPWAARVDRALCDGERLVWEADARSALVCYATPGHAPGHMAFLDEASGGLFCGDLIASQGTILVAPPRGHMGDYLASLERMAALPLRALHPAHGGPVVDAVGKLRGYIAHRLQREAVVLEALRGSGGEWVTGEVLLPRVYADVPEAFWSIAALSLSAHLIHLVELGEARSREGEAGRVEYCAE